MPEFTTFTRKPDAVKGFQWHKEDGAVPPYVEERPTAKGEFFANVFGGVCPPIGDGDWIVIDAHGVVRLFTQQQLDAQYAAK